MAFYQTSFLLVLGMPKAPEKGGHWPFSHMEVLGFRGPGSQGHCFLTSYVDQVLVSKELLGKGMLGVG